MTYLSLGKGVHSQVKYERHETVSNVSSLVDDDREPKDTVCCNHK